MPEPMPDTKPLLTPLVKELNPLRDPTPVLIRGVGRPRVCTAPVDPMPLAAGLHNTKFKIKDYYDII